MKKLRDLTGTETLLSNITILTYWSNDKVTRQILWRTDSQIERIFVHQPEYVGDKWYWQVDFKGDGGSGRYFEVIASSCLDNYAGDVISRED